MLERILDIIKKKKLTPSQFADEIGIQRSGISHIRSGRNNPSLEFVMKVLKRYPDIKPEWLLYGTMTEDKAAQSVEESIARSEKVNIAEKVPDKVLPNDVPATLFDDPGVVESKSENKPVRSLKKEKSGKKIEKIVVFYDDRTFREYEPEQS